MCHLSSDLACFFLTAQLLTHPSVFASPDYFIFPSCFDQCCRDFPAASCLRRPWSKVIFFPFTSLIYFIYLLKKYKKLQTLFQWRFKVIQLTFNWSNHKSSVYFPLWLLRAQKCHVECNVTNWWPTLPAACVPSLTYMTAISSKWLLLRICCRNSSLPLSRPGERRRLQRDIERDSDFSSQACLLSHCGLFRTEAHH